MIPPSRHRLPRQPRVSGHSVAQRKTPPLPPRAMSPASAPPPRPARVRTSVSRGSCPPNLRRCKSPHCPALRDSLPYAQLLAGPSCPPLPPVPVTPIQVVPSLLPPPLLQLLCCLCSLPLCNFFLIARFAQQGAGQLDSSPCSAYQHGPAATPTVAPPLLLAQILLPCSCCIPFCLPLSKQQLTISVLAVEAISCQENATGSTPATPPDPPSRTDTVPDPAGRLHTNHQHSCKARGLLPVTRPSPL